MQTATQLPADGSTTSTVRQALVVIGAVRLVYGIDAGLHGSGQLTLAGGPTFSLAWSVLNVLAAAAALAGIYWTSRGHSALEVVGNYAALALGVAFFGTVVWNGMHGHGSGGLVGGWQPLGLALVAGIRARALVGFRMVRRVPRN